MTKRVPHAIREQLISFICKIRVFFLFYKKIIKKSNNNNKKRQKRYHLTDDKRFCLIITTSTDDNHGSSPYLSELCRLGRTWEGDDIADVLHTCDEEDKSLET